MMKPKLRDSLATTVAEELRAIAERHGGYLNPDAVVEAARDEASPLHPYFTWDDSEAAEDWRRAQAGMLIRRVKLHIVQAPRNVRSVALEIQKDDIDAVRQFQSRPSARGAKGGYESVEEIMSDPEKRAEMVAAATKELRAVQKRYHGLTELAGVWEALDQL